MADYEELCVDKTLLDPKFPGYKLSLQTLPTYTCELHNRLDVVKLRDDQTSFAHLRYFGINNYLCKDSHRDNLVYYIDVLWNIIRIQWCGDSCKLEEDIVFNFGEKSEKGIKRCHASLHILSSDIGLLSDGCGNLMILDTSTVESKRSKWQVLHMCNPLPEHHEFVIIDAVYEQRNLHHKINCILLNVHEPQTLDASYQPHEVHMTWLTYSSDDGQIWREERVRRLSNTRGPDYVAINPQSDCLFIRSDKPNTMTFDSLIPVETSIKDKTDTDQNHECQGAQNYTWSQNNEWIEVEFDLTGCEVSNSDISMNLSRETIKFGWRDSLLLEGDLCGVVDCEASVWSLTDTTLCLHLSKGDESVWPSVIWGDKRGRFILNDEQKSEVKGQLDYVTTENDQDLCANEKAFNTQQLEECDTYSEDNAVMEIIDGNKHNTISQIPCSNNQWLFNIGRYNDEMPKICLRHDVDAIIWKPVPMSDMSKCPWTHEGTIHAFGYIQASKQAQFSMCSPDFSYSIIADDTNHVYLYHQPSPLATTLRNRKTGESVKTLSMQRVITLDSSDCIRGVVVYDAQFFLLTDQSITMVKIL